MCQSFLLKRKEFFSFRITGYIDTVQPADIGWPKGNGKKLSCSQAQLGQATGFAVVCFLSIYVRRLYPRKRPDARFLFPSSNANSEHRYVHFAKRFYSSLSLSLSLCRVEAADYLFVQPKQIRGLSVGRSESAIYSERLNRRTRGLFY